MKAPTFLLQLGEEYEQEQAKLLEQQFQEQEYTINVADLKKLYDLGRGAFGEVSVFVDQKTSTKYARKLLLEAKQFVAEKDVIQQAQSKAGD